MSSGWLRDEISSGWVTANSLCHPDDILFHFMSSGWLNWCWFLIQMSYGNVIISSGWDTLPFLSHPDEIANFDFPHHAVALQRFRMIHCWAVGNNVMINHVITRLDCTYLTMVTYSSPHWNENIVILTQFSILAEPTVVIHTTPGATSVKKIVRMIFPIQCCVSPFLPLTHMQCHSLIIHYLCSISSIWI